MHTITRLGWAGIVLCGVSGSMLGGYFVGYQQGLGVRARSIERFLPLPPGDPISSDSPDPLAPRFQIKQESIQATLEEQ